MYEIIASFIVGVLCVYASILIIMLFNDNDRYIFGEEG